MWRCKNCNYVLPEGNGSIHVGRGHCPKCNEDYVLERYDPLNEEEPEPPI